MARLFRQILNQRPIPTVPLVLGEVVAYLPDRFRSALTEEDVFFCLRRQAECVPSGGDFDTYVYRPKKPHYRKKPCPREYRLPEGASGRKEDEE